MSPLSPPPGGLGMARLAPPAGGPVLVAHKEIGGPGHLKSWSVPTARGEEELTPLLPPGQLLSEGRWDVARWPCQGRCTHCPEYLTTSAFLPSEGPLAAVIAGVASLPLPRPSEVSRLRLEGEALDLWAKGADEIELSQADGGKLAEIRDWASKHPGRVARIAGLLHLVRHVKQKEPWAIPIEPETVAMAWKIGWYLVDHNLLAFDLMGMDPVVAMAKHLLEWIRRRGLNKFTLRDCHQAHRSVTRPQDLLPPLRILVGRGFIRRAPQPERQGRGRPPSPRFEVNPLTHAHKSQKSQYSLFGQGDGGQGPNRAEQGDSPDEGPPEPDRGKGHEGEGVGGQ